MTSTEGRAAVREDARLAAVRRYEILDTPTDGTFTNVAWLAATTFGTPIATVSIVDAERVWFAATHGLDGVAEVGVDPGLCASVVEQDGPYVVTDAAVDPRTLDHPLVRGELGLRFYAAAPITTVDGHHLGTVNVIDRQPREATDTQVSLLIRLAALVAEHLDLRLTALQTVRTEIGLREEAEVRAAASDVRVAAADVRLARLQAAAAALGDADRPAACQLGRDTRCTAAPELKVADSWGDSAWGCLDHVEEAILNARSVFVADAKLAGLSAYLGNRPIH
ncbi:GAF domain-containing protein [Micromonospora kangleipakensis]|uniref:GAF domain-containing protein n=2 Tax=Micromonospora kangleipakensis TaxID=1077942 RepID=A0A4Q8BB69_9ACTN|nr:GAF domain-containing protein [Micromonospora kangleipakensis]